MNEFYVIITPARAGDWGQVILIDARIGYLIECAINDWEENIEEFKSYFKK